MTKRRPGVGTHLALPFPKDCDHDESQIEDSEYSQRWDVSTQLESQQQNTTIQDSQETMMLDLSTNDLPDNHTIPNPNPTTAKDISVQTDSGNSNIISPNLSSNDACTQTLLTEDPENLRVANEYFVPRGSMTKDGKLLQYRHAAPRNSRHNKHRKPKKHVSEDEESDDSPVEEQPQEEQQQRSPSPMLEEPTVRLPEEVLRALIKTPGVLMIAGLVSWDLVARRDNNPTKRTHPNLYTFHKFTDRKYRFIASCCSAGHSVLVDENGEAYTFGRNNCGQLGFGDTVTRNVPEPVPALRGKNIIHAAVGRNHTLFVTDTGTVYSCGENKCGQCGIGSATPQVLKPTRVRYSGAPIVKVGCGAEFSMILDCNGALHSFGLPEYGQLGHNTDGKYFVTSTKLSFHFETIPKHVAHFFEKSKEGHINIVKDVEIVDFSCGNNHTVAIDSRKRAYSWGFGGFGRLGHAEQKDESVPRMIKYFESMSRGVRSVHCGGTYSLAVNELGGLFLFGQTKRTGEANMYPKPVQDLSGWNIRCVGTSNTSIVIAADDSLVAWGVSPTYGELGTGDINKSSARPKEVTRMDGLNITQVTMGYSHTLLLCDDTGEEVKAKLASLPTFNP